MKLYKQQEHQQQKQLEKRHHLIFPSVIEQISEIRLDMI